MKKNIKILMIAPTPFFADRGCHVRIYEEIKALQEMGCDIILCTYHNGRDMEGVRTERIVNIPWYRKLEAGPSWLKPFLDILLLIKSVQVLKKFEPHILHAHLHEGIFIGAILKRLFKKPLLFDYQGSMTAEMVDHKFISKSGLLCMIFTFLEKFLNRRADIIIPSSGGAVEMLGSYFGVELEKIYPVPDGVDIKVFKPESPVASLKKELKIPDNRKVVLYLGLLNEYQGIDLLIEVAHRVLEGCPDIHFLIMGFPNEEKYLKMVKEKGIAGNFTFSGKIDYHQAPKYLSLGDVAVSPKLSATEANGKIYNYMAVGLPTVCFDTPVNREILGELGVYADFGSRDSLATALVNLLSNDDERLTLSAKVRRRAMDSLTWTHSAEKIVDLYSQMIRH